MLDVGRAIHLRHALREDDRDSNKVTTTVEILLDGLRDNEALDTMDDAVDTKYLNGVDDYLARGLRGQMQVVVGESAVEEVGGGPVVRGDSRGENVRHQERLEGPEIARLEQETLEFRV